MPASRIARFARFSPTAATWSRQGSMARMPCRAQASMISARSPCLRTVAVFSDSQRWSFEKSRMSAFDASGSEYQLHARGRELRVRQQAGLVGEPEQLGEVQRGARALLATDHGE